MSKNTQVHERYKIEIMSQDNSVRVLGVPGSRPRVRVIEIARRELKNTPTATHALIRALDGKEHTLYAVDGWWRGQMLALKF